MPIAEFDVSISQTDFTPRMNFRPNLSSTSPFKTNPKPNNQSARHSRNHCNKFYLTLILSWWTKNKIFCKIWILNQSLTGGFDLIPSSEFRLNRYFPKFLKFFSLGREKGVHWWSIFELPLSSAQIVLHVLHAQII